ncbi:hypothetical protein EES44_11440 [Streptomyces sp. ADI96-15]|jgi:hypothetical protein|nr:hypothetical protein EES44_11440 [Streptomyces sp. ADI96-15]
MSSKSRTAPTAPGTHSRPTGRKPEYAQYESFRPARREHAPDTADTARDVEDTP